MFSVSLQVTQYSYAAHLKKKNAFNCSSRPVFVLTSLGICSLFYLM